VALAEKQEKKLSDAPTANVAAYDAYLKGEATTTAMARADVPALRKGLAYYEQAAALDPKFAEAWGRVASCRALLFTNSVPDPALAAGAMDAAKKAAEAGPEKPDGPMAFGMYYRTVERDLPRSLDEYRKAEKLAPGTPDPLRSIGRAEMHMGRWEDSIKHYDEAERLDPKNAINVGNSAQPLLYLRRCAEARQAVDRSLALAPSNLSRMAYKLQAELCMGDVDAARAVVADGVRRVGPADAVPYFAGGAEWLLDADSFALLRRLTPAAFDGDEATWALAQAWASWRAGDASAARDYGEKAAKAVEEQVRKLPKVSFVHLSLGQALAFAGRKQEAVREALAATELEPVDKSPFTGIDMVYGLAQTYMLVGDQDQAIATLERILRSPYYVTPAWLAVDKTWDPLRQNPKFQKLLAAK